MHKLKENNKAKLTTNVIISVSISIILFIIIMQVYSSAVPLAVEAGESLNVSNRCADVGCYYNLSSSVCQANSTNHSNLCLNYHESPPLSDSIGSGGLTFIIIMAALFILIIRNYIKK